MSGKQSGVVSLRLENAGTKSLEGGVATFGQVFAKGEIGSGSHLTARIGGADVAVQMDVKTRYEDGSVKQAVVSVARPDLQAGGSVEVVLGTASGASHAPVVDMVKALASHSFAVDLSGGKGPMHVDVLAALKTALANGTADFWQQGELASQARVMVDLPGSQRMIFDVTAYKGGGMSVEAQFNNDGAMIKDGGRVDYGVRVTMDGKVVTSEQVSQGLFQNWHRSFDGGADGGQGTGSPDAGWLNIRQDMQHLADTGFIAQYNFDNPVSEKDLAWAGKEAAVNYANDPLSSNGVTQYMPGTGGRADIGITTEHNTNWLMTQDARAAAYAMSQAEAASVVPWNMWDVGHGKWLSAEDYPRLWTDGRNGIGNAANPDTRGLTQYADGKSGWTTDSAHQPDLSFVPYVLTGDRWMLDNLQAQGAYNVVNIWEPMRGDSGTIVVDGGQVRHSAWALRQIDNAALASADGSDEKAYFERLSKDNWSWLVSKIPEWTAMQGEAYGWVPGEYGTKGALPPWQQDYFASTAIAAAARGNEDAQTFLEWQSNFLIGRFTHADQGFAMHDGAAYLIAISDPATGKPYTTWAAIGAATEARGWSNGDGWSHSDGDYGQLAMGTLMGIANLTGSKAAAAAYWEVMADNPPHTSADSYTRDPMNALQPPPRPGEEQPGHEVPGDGGTDPGTEPGHQPGTDTGTDPVTQPGTEPGQGGGDPKPDVPTVPVSPKVALSIVLGAQSYDGDPIATVTVDGEVRFHGAVSAQQSRDGAELSLGMVDAGADHRVVVTFHNDGSGPNWNEDRNLFVNDILVDGRSTGSRDVLWSEGDIEYVVREAPKDIPAGSPGVDLAVVLGADVWEGAPIATVFVDGVAAFRGGIEASHWAGGQTVQLGRFAAGVDHKVVVRFDNDGGGANWGEDRNLYVHDVLVDGVSTGQTDILWGNGTRDFVAPAPLPSTDVPLAVVLGAEAFEGNPVATITVDGTVVFKGEIFATHASGGAAIELGNFARGSDHVVAVSFANDHWGGSADRDRNLYVEDILVGGVSTGTKGDLLKPGTLSFDVNADPHGDAPVGFVGQGEHVVRLGLSGDAYLGHAQMAVWLDGQQMIDFRTVAAAHGAGETEYLELRTSVDLSQGDHRLDVRFLEDAWGGSADKDRNLYVDSVHVDGTDLGRSADLMSAGDAVFWF